MSTIAVVTSSPPSTEGGHLVIARALVKAARDSGHQATLVVTPDFGFGRMLETYRANWNADVGHVDHVISLRYPSYAVRHASHVCWLNHTMREYYDLWPSFLPTLSRSNKVKESLRRRLVRAADTWLLTHNVRRVVAQSETIARRMAREIGIACDVLHPPPPQRDYRCDEYGPYIFAVSRLVPLKRVELLVRALAEPPARDVRAVIAGDGDRRGDLMAMARELGVDRRVRFLGRIDEATMLEHFARCRAVCFTPADEDYGFVTVEAFASRKAVVTCRDSGGPADLVRDGESGFIVEPTPADVAAALVRLCDDRALAERMGVAGAALTATMSWDASVRALLAAVG